MSGLFQNFFRNTSDQSQNNQNNGNPQAPAGSNGGAGAGGSNAPFNPNPNNSSQAAGWVPQDGNNNNNGPQGNGNPGGNPGGGTPNPNQSPLDEFSKLWETDPNQGNNAPAGIFNMDPKAVSASIAKMNFAGGISPEVVQKAMSGDASAFSQAMNTVAQTVFGQMMQLTTNMVEHGVRKGSSELEGKLPDMFREWGAGEELSSNPLFNHPSTKPLISALKSQISSKYPHLSSREVAKTAEKYLNSVFETMNSGKPGGNNQPNNQNQQVHGITFPAQGTDFSDFLPE